jgi:hypothetical protein
LLPSSFTVSPTVIVKLEKDMVRLASLDVLCPLHDVKMVSAHASNIVFNIMSVFYFDEVLTLQSYPLLLTPYSFKFKAVKLSLVSK